MAARPVVVVVLGTRPEAIKMAPVARELAGLSDRLDCRVVSTGQHREMLDQILAPLRVPIDLDLRLMAPDQSLFSLSSRAVLAFEGLLAELRPSLVLVQGDTTTAFIGALAASYAQVPVAHVEAGLRTSTKRLPFPEELNRRLISVVADVHFAPTEANRRALLAEGVPTESIVVTGNTGIDTLLQLARSDAPPPLALDERRLVLVTAHRRESFGAPLRQVFAALRTLAESHPEVRIVYPVHLNPNVQGPAHQMLDGLSNVELMPPLDYVSFVRLLSRAWLVLTDSGGVQEEAPALGVPALVMRDETERLEAISSGSARMVGTDSTRIVAEVELLLDANERARRAVSASPFGDGKAAQRIARRVLEHLGLPLGVYAAVSTFSG